MTKGKTAFPALPTHVRTHGGRGWTPAVIDPDSRQESGAGFVSGPRRILGSNPQARGT